MVLQDHKVKCAFFNQPGVFMAVFDNTSEKSHKVVEPFAPAAMQKDWIEFNPMWLGALAYFLVAVCLIGGIVWAVRP
jgi:hypothetical protein